MTTPQLTRHRASRATAIVLTTMLLCAFALILQTERAGAAVYPPPPPTPTATCTPPSSSGSSSTCGTGGVTTHKPPASPNTPLAETGFDTALAMAVVVGLVGVGGVCLYAGSRRRRS